MNRESVIVTSFTITKPGQNKLFQVRVPREVKHLLGVEMGFNWLSGSFPPPPQAPDPWALQLGLRRNIYLGELKLQSYEQSNLFYTGELTESMNHDQGDFSSGHFLPTAFSHKMLSHETEAIVSGKTTIIQGAYRDRMNSSINGSYKYTVHLYLWTESKEPK